MKNVMSIKVDNRVAGISGPISDTNNRNRLHFGDETMSFGIDLTDAGVYALADLLQSFMQDKDVTNG